MSPDGYGVTFDHWNMQKDALAPPASWWLSNGVVWIICPQGHTGTLDHEIDDRGVVTPSVVCPEDGCGFHEHIKLNGWRPGRRQDDAPRS